MKIENYIIRSAYKYPSLYYKETWQKTRLAVLRHVFSVLGNGIDLEKQGDKFCLKSEYTLPKGRETEIKNRIKNSEKVYDISFVDKKSKIKSVYSDLGNRWGEILFEDEFNDRVFDGGIKELFSKLKDGEDYPEYCYEIFPQKPKYSSHPYPFCFYYLNFVEINPNYEKYTYDTIENMSVEELRESKALIPADHSAAIVEVYTDIFNWFSDKDKFYADNYYNFRLDDSINGKFVDAQKSEESWSKFCESYKMPNQNYKNTQEFFSIIKERSRTNYISKAKKIVEAFS